MASNFHNCMWCQHKGHLSVLPSPSTTILLSSCNQHFTCLVRFIYILWSFFRTMSDRSRALNDEICYRVFTIVSFKCIFPRTSNIWELFLHVVHLIGDSLESSWLLLLAFCPQIFRGAGEPLIDTFALIVCKTLCPYQWQCKSNMSHQRKFFSFLNLLLLRNVSRKIFKHLKNSRAVLGIDGKATIYSLLSCLKPLWKLSLWLYL